MNSNSRKFPLLSFCIASIALLHNSAHAEEAYIDSTVYFDCATYDPDSRSCIGGNAQVHSTFAAAAREAKPGMRFNVRGGTFNEALHLHVSGTRDNPIVWRAYEGERVLITQTSTKIADDDFGPIWFDEVEWNVVSGFTLNETIGFVWSVGSNNNVIENNTFDTSQNYPSESKRGGMYFSNSHHNRIRNNTVLRGTDSLALVASNYNVVEDNRFDTASHELWNIKCGSYNVIRNNHFTNPKQKLGSVFDCEENTLAWAGNGRFAKMETKLDATKRNLIEGNTFDISTPYYSSSGGNGIQHAAQDGIIRRNVFSRTNIGLGMTHYDTEALYNYGNRVYHNVFYDNFCAGIMSSSGDAAGRVSDNIYVNNVLWANRGWDFEGGCDAIGDAQVLYRGDPLQGHRFRSNAIAAPNGNKVIREEFGMDSPVSEFPEALSSTLQVDPMFVDAANHDFRLKAESSLVDTAQGLTFTSSAGEGLIVAVQDAAFFYDGWGVIGEQGDRICIERADNCSQIKGVDYDNNVLVLSQPLSWTSGAPVNLTFTGRGPDVGAFERR